MINGNKISGSIIQAGTITASQINCASINYLSINSPAQKLYDNQVLSWNEYNSYGVSAKNCVIHGVPSWSSMFNMNGKTDEDGNYFIVE